MTKIAICDNCGEKDDYRFGDVPFFPEGAVIGFRDETMDCEPATTLEICVACKKKLLNAFPKLKKKLREI